MLSTWKSKMFFDVDFGVLGDNFDNDIEGKAKIDNRVVNIKPYTLHVSKHHFDK